MYNFWKAMMIFKYTSIYLISFLNIDRSETRWFLRNITKSPRACLSPYMVRTFWNQRQRSSCEKVQLFIYIFFIIFYITKCITPLLIYYYVLCRLKKHVSDPKNPPILIFPEGTCINNTSVMQFKKGSFEVDTIIYPVAIKVISHFKCTMFQIYIHDISFELFKILNSLFFKFIVWSTIRRCILEQQSIFDDTIFIYDDVKLGDSLRCVVSPSNV